MNSARYYLPNDAITDALPSPAYWPSIIAQPCQRGDLLCFSHRLLHWGSTASTGAAHRVALSYSYADPRFEIAAFPSSFLPFPPLGLRLALIVGQAILYAAQSPLNKAQLAIKNRIFALHQKYFNALYADKVLNAAQTLKFMAPVKGTFIDKKRVLKSSLVIAVTDKNILLQEKMLLTIENIGALFADTKTAIEIKHDFSSPDSPPETAFLSILENVIVLDTVPVVPIILLNSIIKDSITAVELENAPIRVFNTTAAVPIIVLDSTAKVKFT